MPNESKRKLKEENRVFNTDWELQYFVMSVNNKMQCLLCDGIFSTLKKYNAYQHYVTHKDHKYVKLEGEPRNEVLKKLKDGKKKQLQLLSRILHKEEDTIVASYKVAYLLGKKGKPFCDAELIKDCIIEAVRCLDPDKIQKYKDLPLSRRTNTERQHELAKNLSEQMKKVLQNDAVYYSVALDESTDVTDSAQVLYFVRAVTEEFNVYEELLALGTLNDHIRGVDIFNNFKEIIHDKGLNLSNLVSVCTDGAPSMIGKNEGFVAHLRKELSNTSKCNLISFHCILHQLNLCAKSAFLDDTLKKVINIVNFIRANAMRHRQFRNMLSVDNEIISVDMPYHSKVRWLSQGQVLVKILSLRSAIINFYNENNQSCELSDVKFLQDAAFLCDIMVKQNELNISLQGKNKSIYEMWQKIKVFRKKLVFFKSLLMKPNISENHLSHLTNVMKEIRDHIYESPEKYLTVLDSLIKQYDDRFIDFEKHEIAMKLAFQPHLLNFNEAPEEFQVELIEISEDEILKSQFNNKEDPLKIWKSATEYPILRANARKLISCFGSTYLCEATFSHMKQIKNALRNMITNEHLEDQLRLQSSMLEPDIAMLSQQKQSQKSH